MIDCYYYSVLSPLAVSGTCLTFVAWPLVFATGTCSSVVHWYYTLERSGWSFTMLAWGRGYTIYQSTRTSPMQSTEKIIICYHVDFLRIFKQRNITICGRKWSCGSWNCRKVRYNMQCRCMQNIKFCVLVCLALFRGYHEIWSNLDMDDVVCYWRKLLLEYAELAQWTVEPIPEYRAVWYKKYCESLKRARFHANNDYCRDHLGAPPY